MRALAAAGVAAFLCTGAHAQTLYKCVQGGKTVYQSEACPDEAKQQTLQAPKPGPSKDAAAQAAAATQAGLEIVAGYRACSDGMPEWGEMRKADYDAWRARNAEIVARIETDPEMQRRYRERMQANRYGTPELCQKLAVTLRPEPTPSKAK